MRAQIEARREREAAATAAGEGGGGGGGDDDADAAADAEALEAVEGKWSDLLSISLGDSVGCVVGRDGQAYCGGEPGMYELRLLEPPPRLQPDRIDLIERGLSFSSIAVGGLAARNGSFTQVCTCMRLLPAIPCLLTLLTIPCRNGSFTQLGEQFVCGISHAHLSHCWGKLPPHHGVHLPREDTNPQVTPHPHPHPHPNPHP